LGVDERDYFLLMDLDKTYYYQPSLNSFTALPFSVGFAVQYDRTAGVRSDTFRTPKISPDKNLIAYATPYSRNNLSTSVQFIWDVEEERMYSSMAWDTDWVHFIGWLDNQTLIFQSREDDFVLFNINTDEREVLSLQTPDLSIPFSPWKDRGSYLFYLWSTSSSRGNIFQIFRSDTPYESAVRGVRLTDGTTFYEAGEEEWWWLTGGAAFDHPDDLTPSWSDLGDKIVLPILKKGLTSDLYMVSEDGIIQRLTFFDSSRPVYPNWLNNRRVIFWMDTADSRLTTLYAVDIEDLSIENLGVYADSGTNIIVSPQQNGLVSYIDSGLTLVNLETCLRYTKSLDGWFFLVDWFRYGKWDD
jgi:hypothetical protein